MTPRELKLLIEAAFKGYEREHNARAWMAWQIAAMQRMKKMPPLKKLLWDKSSKPRQSWRQQLQVFSEWAAKHNAALERREKLKEIADGR